MISPNKNNSPTYPKDFSLNELTIIPKVGKAIDIRLVMVELNIFEDLFSHTISGNVVVTDSTNLIRNLPIYGFEGLKVDFNAPLKASFQHEFKIYRISPKSVIEERNQLYIIHFVSQEEFINNEVVVTKSYKGQLISDMVTDIQENYLGSEFDEIEETKFQHHVIVPRLKPFEAIRWLTTRANSGTYAGSNYVYFENQDGFQFVPLEKLVEADSRLTYTYSPQNARLLNGAHASRDFASDIISVESYEFENIINPLDNIITGMYGNKLITHNAIRKIFRETNFDYKKAYPTFKHMELTNKKNDLTGTTGLTFLSDQDGSRIFPDAVTKLFTSGLASEEYPNQVESWMQQRISQKQELNNIVCRIVAPGDSERMVGETVDFAIPSPEPIKSSLQEMETYLQGKYLIASLQHSIVKTAYINNIELVKDSVFSPLP